MPPSISALENRSPIRQNCSEAGLILALEKAGMTVGTDKVRRPDDLPASFESGMCPRVEIDEFDIGVDAHTTVMMNYVGALQLYGQNRHPCLPKLDCTWARSRKCYIRTHASPGHRTLREVALSMTTEQRCVVLHLLCEAVSHLNDMGYSHGAVDENAIWVAPGGSGIVLRGLFSDPTTPPPRTNRADVRGIFSLVCNYLDINTPAVQTVIRLLTNSQLRDASMALLSVMAQAVDITRRQLTASLSEYLGTFAAAHPTVVCPVDTTSPSFTRDFGIHVVQCIQFIRTTATNPVFALFKDRVSVGDGIAPCRAVIRRFFAAIEHAGYIERITLDGGFWPTRGSTDDVVFQAYGYALGLAMCFGGFGAAVPSRCCMYLMYGLDDITEATLHVDQQAIAAIDERHSSLMAMRAGFAPFSAWLRRGGYSAAPVYDELIAVAKMCPRERLMKNLVIEGMTRAQEAAIIGVLEGLQVADVMRFVELVTEADTLGLGAKLRVVKTDSMDEEVKISACGKTLFIPSAVCEKYQTLEEFVQNIIATADGEFECQ